jgi:hypothetical protein
VFVEELELHPPHTLVPDSSRLNCWRKVSPVEPSRAAVDDTVFTGDGSRGCLAAAPADAGWTVTSVEVEGGAGCALPLLGDSDCADGSPACASIVLLRRRVRKPIFRGNRMASPSCSHVTWKSTSLSFVQSAYTHVATPHQLWCGGQPVMYRGWGLEDRLSKARAATVPSSRSSPSSVSFLITSFTGTGRLTS